jgi:hypothetical protein
MTPWSIKVSNQSLTIDGTYWTLPFYLPFFTWQHVMEITLCQFREGFLISSNRHCSPVCLTMI